MHSHIEGSHHCTKGNWFTSGIYGRFCFNVISDIVKGSLRDAYFEGVSSVRDLLQSEIKM